jgi:uncharacterized delta-60 repeat protein
LSRKSKLSFDRLEDRNLMAAGVLDPTFGNGGFIVHDFDANSPGDIPAQLAILPDGKILVAGTRNAYGNDEDFAVARYLPNGSLDTTFGVGGKAVVNFTTRDMLTSMIVTPSGQILLGGGIGIYPRQGALARLNANGSLDTTFGVNGKVVFDPGNGEEGITSLALQSDGSILAAGTLGNGRPMVARFTSGGVLDATFGTNGVAQPLNGTLSTQGTVELLVQTDDKVVLGGAADDFGYHIYVARFAANGLPDASFDSDGIAGAGFTSVQSQGIKDIALQADGKILVVGNRFNVAGNSTADMAVVRFNANGSLDTNFANGGYFVSDWNTVEDEVIAVTVQTDGRIVLVGRQNQDSLIARLLPDGTFDTSFGTNGSTVTALASNDNFYDVAQQADGRIVAMSDADRNFGLARYLNSPVAILGGPYSVAEGGSVALNGSGYDDVQAANTLAYAWDLDGDGIFGETGANAQHGDETGRTPTFQAGNLDGAGSWTVKLRVTNNGGASYVAQGSVALTNVAPAATFGNSGPVNEGSTATVTFSNQTDASAADVSAGFHYAFDYDNDGVWDVGDGTYAGSSTSNFATIPSQYLDDIAPSRTVKGRILDKDGGARDYTTTIAINPVNDPPTEIQFSSGFIVVEKAPADTVVGQLATVDADLGAEGDSHQYSLTDSAGGRFKIVGNQVWVADGSLLNSQANATHTIRVRTTDSHNASIERDYSIVVVPRSMSYQLDKIETALGTGPTYQLRQAGNEAWFLDTDHELTYAGTYYQDSAGANEKWLKGKQNPFGNTWYFIKPSGELYAWNGNGGPPSGTVLRTLQPLYWQYPQLLHNATTENLAFVVDQFLNLRTDNGNLWENYSGLNERWLLGNGGWFYITPNGDFFGGGGRLTTFDPIYYQEITRLTSALPSQINAALVPGQNGAPSKLAVDPVAGYVGDWVIELKSSGSFESTHRFAFSVTNSVPTITPIAPQTMPTSQDTLTVPVAFGNTDPGETVYLAAQAGSLAYVVDTTYQLQFAGTGYDNSLGLGDRWFSGIVNSYGNRWYFIKPSGEFYAWSGAGAQGTLLETLEPLFHRFPGLFAQSQAQSTAYELDRWVGLYQDAGGVYQNWNGQNERWLRGAGGEWYYIKPDGKFYQGNGQLLATFDPVHYAELNRLTNPLPNQVTVSTSGSNVIVDPAAGYVGNIWILVEASDLPFNATNRRRSAQYFKVTITP